MMRTRTAIGILLVGLALAGCRRDRSADLGIPDTTFVAALADLRHYLDNAEADASDREAIEEVACRLRAALN